METIGNRILGIRAEFQAGNAQPAALDEKIQEIYDEVIQPTGIPEDRKALIQYIFLFQPKINHVPLALMPDEVHTIKGTINQFSGEESSSACTCCAQGFLTNLLSEGIAYDVQSDEIDRIVRDGKKSYNLLMKNAQLEAKNLAADGEPVPIFESLSHLESVDIYGLRSYGGAQEKYLENVENSTRTFFETELRNLDEVCNDVGNVGGVIHSQGKTFAIAILDQGLYREYVLFDSHGCEILNGSEEAFVTVTQSQAEMARVLSLLCPYNRVERNVPGEDPIPEDLALDMDKDNNPYILYVVTLPKEERALLGMKDEEKVLLAASGEEEGEGSLLLAVPEEGSSRPAEERTLPAASCGEDEKGPPPPEGLEEESSNRPAIDLHSGFGEAELRERKLRTFFALSLMSIITTSYAYRKGLSEFLVTRIPPEATSYLQHSYST